MESSHLSLPLRAAVPGRTDSLIRTEGVLQEWTTAGQMANLVVACRAAVRFGGSSRPGSRAQEVRMVSLGRWQRAQRYERSFWASQVEAIAAGAALDLEWYKWRAQQLRERLQ